MAKTAFEASRATLFLFDPEKLVLIGLDTDGPEHPLYDERVHLPVSPGMVANMKKLGKILLPVTVRKNGDRAEVVSGRQRVKAARKANEELREEGKEPLRIPVTLERADDIRAFEMMISENENRVQDNWVTKARKMQWYIDRGHTEEETAVIFGVTAQTVKIFLSMLDLDPQIQGYVTAGKISATAASALAELPREEQVTEAQKLLASGDKPTVNNVRHAVRKAKAQKEGGNEPVVKAPSKKDLKRVLKKNAELDDEEQLDPEFVRAIRFVLGDLNPTSIRGLSALLQK